MHKKQNTIKIKVIGWFLLAALAVLLTGIISYNSYHELLRSLENPSNQQTKLKELGDILANITKAEAKMRAYSLTRDPGLLESYQSLVISINQELETIQTIEPVSAEFNLKVDSVSHLLDDQMGGIASYIELKNTLNQLSFSSMALEEINSTTDSIPTLRTTTTTTITTTTVEPLPSSSHQKRKNSSRRSPSDKRQQKKRAQEIAREIVRLEKEPQIQTETTITTDTSFVQPDTVLGSIQQILVDIGKEESQYQEVLAGKELKLIESSMVIIDQIRGLISGLEKQELAQNIQRANNAKVIASRSTLTISIIIFICLVLGILFTYLIFKDVRIGDYYNKQLIGAKNEAEQLAESKQQFLANMSHEIRTPLNAIIGFTEQLSGTSLEPTQQQYLDAVQTSSQHLLHTVNDILDYSKIEAGELNIDNITFELGNTLEEVIEALQLKASEKELNLSLEMNPLVPVYLIGDPFRLKQVLFNLVSNGIKFTDNGYVKVQCNYTNSNGLVKVVLSVRDSGIGIPEEKQGDVFGDFKQVDPSATRRYEGTGLGLAICKKLVEVQAGSISVQSNGRQGSEFIVQLDYPISQSGSMSNSNNIPIAPNSLHGLRLLVADDDQFNIQLLKAILEKWGAQVSYCANGKEAKKQITRHTFDLILTDINMPEVGGVELSRFIRSLDNPEKQEIPIIALTANVMKTDLEKYLEAGINDFILKPFKEVELYQKIRKMIPVAKFGKIPVTVQFNLDEFKKFSGGDDKALLPILEAFYTNLKQNVKSLMEFTDNQDLEAIAELAHKMISSFGHVHAMEPVNKLRQLETKIRTNETDIPLRAMVEEIQQLSHPILESLEQEIEERRSNIGLTKCGK